MSNLIPSFSGNRNLSFSGCSFGCFWREVELAASKRRKQNPISKMEKLLDSKEWQAAKQQ